MPTKPCLSLHTARSLKECGLCGDEIPTGGEYWRVKGGPQWVGGARIVRGRVRHIAVRPVRLFCCMCHALFVGQDDGWKKPPDGREVIAALRPEGAQ